MLKKTWLSICQKGFPYLNTNPEQFIVTWMAVYLKDERLFKEPWLFLNHVTLVSATLLGYQGDLAFAMTLHLS